MNKKIATISFILLAFTMTLYGCGSPTASVDITNENKPLIELESVQYAKDLEPTKVIKRDLESELSDFFKSKHCTYSLAYKSLKTGEEVIINEREMKAASVIKIFIMVEAYNQISNGLVKELDEIEIESSMKVGGTGSLQYSKEGVKKSIKELIELMITESDNTATNILIDKLGMNQINEGIKRLNCKNTILQRKMMDNKSLKEGKDNYTSVCDLMNVLDKLYNGECIDKSFDKVMLDILKRQENNTKIPELLPKDVIIAHKTGSLTGVENDVGIIYSDKADYILCILTQDDENSKDIIDVICKLSKHLYEYIIE